MASLEELRNVRLSKIELLKEAKMDPYPASVPLIILLKKLKINLMILKKV